MPGRHAKPKKDETPQEPQPGVAGMSQGEQEPETAQHHSEAADALAEGASAEKPEQPDLLVTGAEALAEQQQNPELKDNTGNRGG